MWDEDEYWTPEREREESVVATQDQAVREWAWNAGSQVPDQAWMLHDLDVWVANPHYRGAPVPHPEADDYDVEGDHDGQPDEAQEWHDFDPDC